MAEYIERGQAIKELLKYAPEQVGYSRQDAADCIRYMPAADVEPVRHGQWKQARYTEAPLYICSECDKPEYKRHKFCPNCGARMDGGDEE